MLDTFDIVFQSAIDDAPRCALSVAGLRERGTSYGVFARRGSSVTTLEDPGRLRLTGVSAVPELSMAFLRESSLADYLELVDQTASVESFRRYSLPLSEDEGYCPHGAEDLTLECDVTNGVSPMRCRRCGGFVSRYSLGLPSELSTELWAWESDYLALFDLWLYSSTYDAYAGSELRDRSRAVHLEATRLAGAISAATGAAVEYAPTQIPLPE
ncbi:MAG TPA: hypothetical protein P5081_03810 [Phycisphaerae bacterium]|nr:hypothetical protein [Phycisphaerae bacterium]HRW51985.1 hypothetical protein [Phycisphaerae bacterium]